MRRPAKTVIDIQVAAVVGVRILAQVAGLNDRLYLRTHRTWTVPIYLPLFFPCLLVSTSVLALCAKRWAWPWPAVLLFGFVSGHAAGVFALELACLALPDGWDRLIGSIRLAEPIGYLYVHSVFPVVLLGWLHGGLAVMVGVGIEWCGIRREGFHD